MDTSLLTAAQPERYQFHDLVRVSARERATRQHAQWQQVTALTRAFGFYTATAWRTVALLRPGDPRLGSADARWVQGGIQLVDAPAALEWLEAERANLLAAIQQAASSAAVPAGLASQLARALYGFFDMRSHWQNWMQAPTRPSLTFAAGPATASSRRRPRMTLASSVCGWGGTPRRSITTRPALPASGSLATVAAKPTA